MFSTRFIISLFLLCYSFLFSSVSIAEEAIPIGFVTYVRNKAVISTATGERPVKLNDKVFLGEQIITEENSKVILTFRDKSTFEIAPLSNVVLDSFIFNPKEGILEKSVQILKGTFRYISGVVVKNSNTEIKTPLGTAGIRGSEVVIQVGANKVMFVVNEGTLTMTDLNGAKTTYHITEGGILTPSGTQLATQEQKTDFATVIRQVLGKEPSGTLTKAQEELNKELNKIPARLQQLDKKDEDKKDEKKKDETITTPIQQLLQENPAITKPSPS